MKGEKYAYNGIYDIIESIDVLIKENKKFLKNYYDLMFDPTNSPEEEKNPPA